MPVWNRVTGEEAFRIVHLYVTTGMTMEQLADALGRSYCTVNRWYLRRLEGATTISKESTLKWVEAHCPGGLLKPGDDIV